MSFTLLSSHVTWYSYMCTSWRVLLHFRHGYRCPTLPRLSHFSWSESGPVYTSGTPPVLVPEVPLLTLDGGVSSRHRSDVFWGEVLSLWSFLSDNYYVTSLIRLTFSLLFRYLVLLLLYFYRCHRFSSPAIEKELLTSSFSSPFPDVRTSKILTASKNSTTSVKSL